MYRIVAVLLLSSPAFAMSNTTDWVHEIAPKDDIRRLAPDIYNTNDFYAAIKRQPVIWGKSDNVVSYADLEEVNRRINHSFKMDYDVNVWGVDDYTATPRELKAKGAGDCEDFSMVKYHALAMLGVPSGRMNFYSGYYNGTIPHNILVVELSDGKEYVLDTMSDKLIKASEYMHVRFTPKHRITDKAVSLW